MSTYLELFGLLILLMLPFLYETNHVFRYYIKFLLYYGIVSLNSILLIPAFLLRPCDVRNLLWASAFCHRISSLIGLRWELRGKEHLEKDQACIIVANHQSSLDILGMFDIWPVMNKCTVVAKRELFYAWPFGLAAWLAGLIFIDRVRGEKARATLNAVNTSVKKQKIKLWIFPEGTRRNTGELHPFKKGAFHMAIDEQIPILPVVFSSYCTFLNDKKRILNPGQIIITAMPIIPTEGLTKDDIPELMERVHKMMSETFKQSSAEILQRYAAHTLTKTEIINSTTTLDVTTNAATTTRNSATTTPTTTPTINNSLIDLVKTPIQSTTALTNCSFNSYSNRNIISTSNIININSVYNHISSSNIITPYKENRLNCICCNTNCNRNCEGNSGTTDNKLSSSITSSTTALSSAISTASTTNTEAIYQETLSTTNSNSSRALVH